MHVGVICTVVRSIIVVQIGGQIGGVVVRGIFSWLDIQNVHFVDMCSGRAYWRGRVDFAVSSHDNIDQEILKRAIIFSPRQDGEKSIQIECKVMLIKR